MIEKKIVEIEKDLIFEVKIFEDHANPELTIYSGNQINMLSSIHVYALIALFREYVENV